MKRLPPLLLYLVLPVAAWAHTSSDSYLRLFLDSPAPHGQWDIALLDLDFALDLDSNGDGAITWGELQPHHPAIATYALSRLTITSGSEPCLATPTAQLVDRHSDGGYSVLEFSIECPQGASPARLEYHLFFDLDPTHRGLVNLSYSGGTETAVLSPERRQLTLSPHPGSSSSRWRDYWTEGVRHIWSGTDHILFLLTLLLPAVLVYRGKRWVSANGLKPALLDTVKTVTAFTLAHSITLSLAVLQWVTLPSRLVEAAIALSVIAASLNNLRPMFLQSRWLLAFLFGLLHGFGFAGALSDLGLPREALALALLSFNLGVEAGQLAIVLLVFPLLYWLRATRFFQPMLLRGGSYAAAVLATLWLVERV